MIRTIGVLIVCVWLLAVPAQAATTIFNDTFTGAAGNLSAHSPDTGTSWTSVLQSTVLIKLDGSGNAYDGVGPDSAGYQYLTADATYPSANYNITATLSTFSPGGGTRMIGIIGRYVDSSNYYMATIIDSGQANDVRIYKVVAGTATKISGSEDTNPTTNDVFIFEFNGSAIGLKKNGSYVINPITDATFSSAGKAGLGAGDFGTETGMQTAGTGALVTTFLVDYAPAAVSGRRKPVVFQ